MFDPTNPEPQTWFIIALVHDVQSVGFDLVLGTRLTLREALDDASEIANEGEGQKGVAVYRMQRSLMAVMNPQEVADA